jgi:hypothetical protein
MYTIDTRMRPIALSFNLPAKHERDRFPLQVNLDYQVEDSERMVDQSIEDTESLVASALEDRLRPVCRRFTLDQHTLLLQELESVLQSDFLLPYGLRKIRCTVDLRIDTTFEERIQQLKDLDLLQSRRREVQLPSGQPGLFFHARVSLTYHVVDRAMLPSETLSRGEEQLWPQVESQLWAISRHFKIGQEADVEQAIQNGIATIKPQGYGLAIQSISVTIEPDKSISGYQQMLLQIGRNRIVTKNRDIATAEQKQRLRDLTREELTLYRAIVKDGELLALKLAQDPALVDQVLEHLSEQDREKFARDLARIRLLIAQSKDGDKGLFDDEYRSLIQGILNGISDYKSWSQQAGSSTSNPFSALHEDDEAAGAGTSASTNGTGTPSASGGASANGHQQQKAGAQNQSTSTPTNANGAAAPGTPPAPSGDAKGQSTSAPADVNGTAALAKPADDTSAKGDDGLQKQVGGPAIEP